LNDTKKLLGRSFDFKIDEEAEEWYKAGGLEKCPMVCAIAARIAADIILSIKAENAGHNVTNSYSL